MSHTSLRSPFIACTSVQLRISQAQKSQLSQDGMKLTGTWSKVASSHSKFEGGTRNMVSILCSSPCHQSSDIFCSKGQLYASIQQRFTSLIQTSTILHTLQVFWPTSLKPYETASANRLDFKQLLNMRFITAAACH